MAGAFLIFFGFSSGGYQLFSGKEPKSYLVPFLITIIIAVLVISSVLCQSEWIVDWNGFPERLKI